jgi:hypothetical protein
MKDIFELTDKLKGKTLDEKQAVIFMWVKSGVITLKQFKDIVRIELLDEMADLIRLERLMDE